ncbi:hypothetical protein [Aquimarina sp. RZ0]|uniref:hypothetical protein n=1 Tax=Aquimarina sp. RZ0 TaxID=2607730 RepID=UPI0011F17718|nr:hypothetical protein [Aquimarina sp. RZ0]KAA1247914.1 hypothetical protein F0000_01460 [Aquimarina sp. RZ0]
MKIGNQDGRLDAFVTTDKDFIEQFAGKIVEDSTTASPDIYQYLIQDLSENFKSKLDQPGIDQALFSI